mmetsp:Transcript_18180/g.28483  ORF Transcript_18180/g.28483 Transcript_18180/m.28483 type:complete len:285 (-) Transcript_18180:51-905(-)|eukprot:CAMPEP_0201523274 /NCGR_PEP_ID=MMETSP0161_2-20130828/19215_1 /ASSEMBLY_ACC=CAM_ASM_000251 /TAXON_ID=180227 /ORGANISM="Neoparamoeba aestuarina, Strain SoJaBio B1-5/56/2" /LENGTH=284 /DNA_ID=CAMNT_0047922331 /DNA_START=54 /DNA_END=908 /DNA_ORIENTATION=-
MVKFDAEDVFNNEDLDEPLDNQDNEAQNNRAVFQLSHAEKEWHVRDDEEIMFELKLDGSGVKTSGMTKACATGLVMGGPFVVFSALVLPPQWMAFMMLPPSMFCCFGAPAIMRQGESALQSKIFFTNKAVYHYSGDSDVHTPDNKMGCALPWTFTTPFPIRKRLEYTDISKVECIPKGGCCANEGDGHEPLRFYTDDAVTVVTVSNGGSVRNVRTHDSKGIYFERVYHAHDVVKMVKFICDAKQNGQEIDWASIKESMKDYVTLITDHSQVNGVAPQTIEMMDA